MQLSDARLIFRIKKKTEGKRSGTFCRSLDSRCAKGKALRTSNHNECTNTKPRSNYYN